MKVHILLTGTGWILEEFAKRLADALPYVSFGTSPDPAADIQYYITYAGLNKRVSPIEMGWFTHLEPREPLKSLFLKNCRRFDYCITQSQQYFEILEAHGANNLSIISPGVDLERFMPKLKIGVVGRTYETGRKGEDTIAQLMDLDFVEWKFTGNGWPGKSVFIPDADLPDFYRSLDVLLITSAYEGGPMCAIEALACGIPVVSTSVGWMRELPHIPFEYGNASQLKVIFKTLFAKKLNLRQAVLDRTWDTYIDHHDKLFTQAYNKYYNSQKQPDEKSTLKNWIEEVCKPMIGDVLCVHQGKKTKEIDDMFMNANNIFYCNFKTQERSKKSIISSLEKIKKEMFDVVYVNSTYESLELGERALEIYPSLLHDEGLLVSTLRISDRSKQLDDSNGEAITETIRRVEKNFKLLAVEDIESMEQNGYSTWSFVAKKISGAQR